MLREKKAQSMDEIEKLFRECNSGVLTDYRGITAQDITTLRRKLDGAGITYKVVKNTLAGFAAEKAGKASVTPALKGPVAIAFGARDASVSAKALVDYIRTSKVNINVLGGFLGDRLLTADEVKNLAALPPREVLIAQLLGNMQGPIAALVSYLNAPLTQLAMVLQARVQQMEAK